MSRNSKQAQSSPTSRDTHAATRVPPKKPHIPARRIPEPRSADAFHLRDAAYRASCKLCRRGVISSRRDGGSDCARIAVGGRPRVPGSGRVERDPARRHRRRPPRLARRRRARRGLRHAPGEPHAPRRGRRRGAGVAQGPRSVPRLRRRPWRCRRHRRVRADLVGPGRPLHRPGRQLAALRRRGHPVVAHQAVRRQRRPRAARPILGPGRARQLGLRCRPPHRLRF